MERGKFKRQRSATDDAAVSAALPTALSFARTTTLCVYQIS